MVCTPYSTPATNLSANLAKIGMRTRGSPDHPVDWRMLLEVMGQCFDDDPGERDGPFRGTPLR